MMNNITAPALSDNISERARDLLRTDQLIGGLKDGTINTADAINFLNGK